MIVLTELVVLLLLLVANGVFAMTEIAIVSARKPRLRRLAEQGDTRARAALELAESPNHFLSTVQVGIFAGAFGGATLAEKLAQPLGQIGWLAPYAKQVSLGLVVLVIGELNALSAWTWGRPVIGAEQCRSSAATMRHHKP